jgi:hypothetical protein
MVVIADVFRAHWEAADEFRKLAEVEESAAWLWMLDDPEGQHTLLATSACVEADRSAASGSQPCIQVPLAEGLLGIEVSGTSVGDRPAVIL